MSETPMQSNQIARKMIELRGNTPRKDVAKAIGVSVSAIQMYEGGHRVPNDDIKVRIAKHYKASVQDIFFEDESSKHILDGVKSITILNAQTGEEIAAITPDTVTTASDEIVVKFSLERDTA